MEVDHVIKIIEAANRPKLNKSSKRRKKKFFLNSFEERFWISFLFLTGSIYWFFWFFGYADLIHDEIKIFHSAHQKLFKISDEKNFVKKEKSNYEKLTEKKKFEIDFNEFEEIEFSFKELEKLIIELGKQRKINENLLSQELQVKSNALEINNLMKIYYADIIKNNISIYLKRLSFKLESILSNFKGQLSILHNLMKENNDGIIEGFEIKKLFLDKRKSLKLFIRGGRECLNNLKDLIDMNPKFQNDTLLKPAKEEEPEIIKFYKEFFSKLYDLNHH